MTITQRLVSLFSLLAMSLIVQVIISSSVISGFQSRFEYVQVNAIPSIRDLNKSISATNQLGIALYRHQSMMDSAKQPAAEQRIDQLMLDIFATSEEQSSGTAQINVAVNQMDQATQQNAVLLEQSASSANELPAVYPGSAVTRRGPADSPDRFAPIASPSLSPAGEYPDLRMRRKPARTSRPTAVALYAAPRQPGAAAYSGNST